MLILVVLIPVVAGSLILLSLIGGLSLRDSALATHVVASDGNVPGHNLRFGWLDHYGEAGFRGVIYPQYLNPKPSARRHYRDGNVENPQSASWRDGAMFYGEARIKYPPGKDTAVIAPDDSITFISLSPDYLNYGPVQSTRVWFVFEDRKRFPRYEGGLNVEKLEAAGLLPSWARFAPERLKVGGD